VQHGEPLHERWRVGSVPCFIRRRKHPYPPADVLHRGAPLEVIYIAYTTCASDNMPSRLETSSSKDFWQHAATSDVDIVIKVAGSSSAAATYLGHSPVLNAATPAWKVCHQNPTHRLLTHGNTQCATTMIRDNPCWLLSQCLCALIWSFCHVFEHGACTASGLKPNMSTSASVLHQ
jgi:hypothetical protein